MNKNLKKVIAIALAVGTVSAVAPATSGNLLTTKAYATDNDNSDETLDSLSLETSTGGTIKLYSDSGYDSDSRLNDDDTPDEANDTTYYAKTSASTIDISKSGPSSRYVKVFKGTTSSTKGKSISSDISLSSGTTTLVVRVYYNEPDSDVRYDDDSDVSSEYKIKVKYTGDGTDTSSDATADDYDEIYLDKLTVDGENISLSDSKIAYSYNVPNSSATAIIKALPQDTDYDTVTINGTTVDDSDSFKKIVSLNVGVNKFEIDYENEDGEERVYTLSITRAAATIVTPVVTIKPNQWVIVNGSWQYNDSTGKPLKNMWFFDRNYGKSYYLQADGSMATGWVSYGGGWYYVGADGAMKTGWQLASGTWYYLNSQTGIMAYSTTIDGYKLGSNGAWVQ